MTLENWLYRRDVAERLWFFGIDVIQNLARQEEAEQEIEMELRR